jgi:hypothetical protein
VTSKISMEQVICCLKYWNEVPPPSLKCLLFKIHNYLITIITHQFFLFEQTHHLIWPESSQGITIYNNNSFLTRGKEKRIYICLWQSSYILDIVGESVASCTKEQRPALFIGNFLTPTAPARCHHRCRIRTYGPECTLWEIFFVGYHINKNDLYMRACMCRAYTHLHKVANKLSYSSSRLD